MAQVLKVKLDLWQEVTICLNKTGIQMSNVKLVAAVRASLTTNAELSSDHPGVRARMTIWYRVTRLRQLRGR